MENKKKLDRTTKVLIGIFVIIVLLIGLLFSYAYYSLDVGGTLSNSNITGTLECLDISYTESNSINLTNAHPVTDDYALTKMTPVTVTITNNCSSNRGDISYTLALSTIYEKALNYDDKYIPDTKIRTHVKKTVEGTETTKVNTKFLSKIGKLDPTSNSYKYITNNFTNDSNYTNYNMKDMYRLDSGLIKNNEVITYKVYMWIDYYEGDPARVGGEYNNSTKGKKFEGAISLVANAEEYKPQFAEELIASGELWQSGLEGDGYRYTGGGEYQCTYGGEFSFTSGAAGCPSSMPDPSFMDEIPLDNNGQTLLSNAPKNYICFGTSDLSECKANEEKYMYRIIGVFPSDDTGKQHIKLIKYKQLGSYMWHSTDTTDISWEESDLYKGLNGISGGSYSNLFIGNTTYDYLQDNKWLNKIADWKWTATNTLLCGKDGLCNDETSGPYYYRMATEQVYLHEMHRTMSTEECKGITSSRKCNINIGEWTYPIAKIGLMYFSDYLLSSGWLLGTNNMIIKSGSEWLITRGGYYNSHFRASSISDFYHQTPGASDGLGITVNSNVRPVFYLDSTVTTSGGTGEYSNPYLING